LLKAVPVEISSSSSSPLVFVSFTELECRDVVGRESLCWQ